MSKPGAYGVSYQTSSFPNQDSMEFNATLGTQMPNHGLTGFSPDAHPPIQDLLEFSTTLETQFPNQKLTGSNTTPDGDSDPMGSLCHRQ